MKKKTHLQLDNINHQYFQWMNMVTTLFNNDRCTKKEYENFKNRIESEYATIRKEIVK